MIRRRYGDVGGEPDESVIIEVHFEVGGPLKSAKIEKGWLTWTERLKGMVTQTSVKAGLDLHL